MRFRSENMRVLVIGNPVAGTGQAERRIDEFVGQLKRRGHEVEICITTTAGQALERARFIGKNIDRLVVAGGDGTINEVLNGLVEPSRVPILHLPIGTANQLARTLGLPFEPEKLIGILEHGSVKRIDIGVAGSRRFLMLVSAGFDARVAEEVKKVRNGTLGYSGYMVPVLKTVAGHQPGELTLTVDDGTKVTGYIVMVLKVRHYGGLFVFDEDAALDSGLLHVCVFRERAIPWLIVYAVAGLMGKACSLPGVARFTGHSVRIESDEPVPIEIDGDHAGTTPVDIKLMPTFVPVIVPPTEFPLTSCSDNPPE
jgi:diacylglycerol kinase (ATP)